MTIFKTFLKVLNKNKYMILLYSTILIFFAGFNTQNNNSPSTFKEQKPDVLIINNDENKGITKELTKYIKEKSNIKKIKNNKSSINDALFYRDVSFIIYIPKNYRKDFLEFKNPTIKIKKTGDYNSSLSTLELTSFIKQANIYLKSGYSEDEIIKELENNKKDEIVINVKSKLDTKKIQKAVTYYNFLNYSIIAGLVYVICLIIFSFREEGVNKRTIISSINYKKYNRILLLSNLLLSIVLWLFYVFLSIIVVGDIMISKQGLMLIINSFIFTCFSTALAFCLANLIKDKNVVTSLVNVIGLGSSFLCGAFVPVEFLPNEIIKLAHILPSYWYVKTNEYIKNIDILSKSNIKEIIINFSILILFSIIIVIITNLVSKKNRKIG